MNRLFWVIGRDVGFRSPNRDCPAENGTVGKYGAPRSKHKGKKQMFHKLGNKLATSTGNQIKKFLKKKKTRRVAKKALHKVGRELFAPKKIRLESKPQDTPFAKQLRESIKMASPQIDSTHIGQTFNI